MEGDKFHADLNAPAKAVTKTEYNTVVFIAIKPYFQ